MKTGGASSLCVACLCLLAAGCSVVESLRELRDASTALREGDDAVAEGEYEAGIGSYLKARRSLLTARRYGFRTLSDDEKLASVDRRIEACEQVAEEEGYIRVGVRYVRGDELGKALAGELKRMLDGRREGPGAPSRVVAEELEASCLETPDGRYDVTLVVTAREAEDEADFSQDTWALVRFLMEGGWGHGFCFTAAPRFDARPYMGTSTRWGLAEGEGAESRFVGLAGRIGRLTVVVERGVRHQDPGDGYGARGFRTLEAVGPYWRKEPYRSYSMDRRDAERLNWAEAGRIPDSTLYGLMRIAPVPRPTAGAPGAAEVR